MKVLVAGGYGFLGQKIIKDLAGSGFDVTIAGRRRPDEFNANGFSHLSADFTEPGPWQSAIRDYDVIINLVGVNIFQRWNSDIKKSIYDSRILSTRNIIEALKDGRGRKKILINASAVGIYGGRGDEDLNENSTTGDDFLSVVCRDWEAEAMKGINSGLRVSILRFGTVLGKDGGAFTKLRQSFTWCMGSKLGNGKQWFPWIHTDDVSGIIIKIIKNSKMSGIYNCVSPGVVTNAIFTDIMAEEIHRPVIIPFVPAFILKIVFGEFGGFLVEGQKVFPVNLKKEGYKFKYPDLRKTLRALLD